MLRLHVVVSSLVQLLTSPRKMLFCKPPLSLTEKMWEKRSQASNVAEDRFIFMD